MRTFLCVLSTLTEMIMRDICRQDKNGFIAFLHFFFKKMLKRYTNKNKKCNLFQPVFFVRKLNGGKCPNHSSYVIN